MDRLSRKMAVGFYAVVLASITGATGCRSMRSEVPPGKPYSTTGEKSPLGLNSDPRPATGAAAGMYGGALTPGAPGPDGVQSMTPSNGLSQPPQLGIPAPNAGNYAAPTANRYGSVGSAGTGQ
jgi:hypothetical protein